MDNFPTQPAAARYAHVTLSAAQKERRGFVVLRRERINDQPMFVPYKPTPFRKASPTDAATWGTLGEVLNACNGSSSNLIGVIEDTGGEVNFRHLVDARALDDWLALHPSAGNMPTIPIPSTDASVPQPPDAVAITKTSASVVAITTATQAPPKMVDELPKPRKKSTTAGGTDSTSTHMIRVADIKLDPAPLCRASIDDERVAEFAEDMQDGAAFPPVDVFSQEEGEYWLADGTHRIKATVQLGRTEIMALVHRGNRSDAILHALKANDTHGIRRSNADKRACVLLAFKTFGNLSNVQIAQKCGVSDHTVGTIRANIENLDVACGRTIGADGKSRPARRAKCKPAPTVSPAENTKPASTTAQPKPQEETAPATCTVQAPPQSPVASRTLAPVPENQALHIYRTAGDDPEIIVVRLSPRTDKKESSTLRGFREFVSASCLRNMDMLVPQKTIAVLKAEIKTIGQAVFDEAHAPSDSVGL